LGERRVGVLVEHDGVEGLAGRFVEDVAATQLGHLGVLRGNPDERGVLRRLDLESKAFPAHSGWDLDPHDLVIAGVEPSRQLDRHGDALKVVVVGSKQEVVSGSWRTSSWNRSNLAASSVDERSPPWGIGAADRVWRGSLSSRVMVEVWPANRSATQYPIDADDNDPYAIDDTFS